MFLKIELRPRIIWYLDLFALSQRSFFNQTCLLNLICADVRYVFQYRESERYFNETINGVRTKLRDINPDIDNGEIDVEREEVRQRH